MHNRLANRIRTILLSLFVATGASILNAQTFSPAKNLSNNGGHSGSPQVAVDSRGNINVVWNDDTPGNLDIFFSRSSNDGATFSTPRNLSNDPGLSFSPQIAVDSAGNINVVWTDMVTATNDEIYFSRSTDGGTTFSTPTNLSNNAGNSFNSQIAVDAAGNINVIWEDDTLGNREIFFSRSNNGGTTFTTPVNVSNNAGSSEVPQIALDGSGNIRIVWSDKTPGNYDIFFAGSTDGGVTFSVAQNLSNNAGDSRFPQVAADNSGNINVVWEDLSPGNFDILFSRSSDGVNFSVPVNISNTADSSFFSHIAVDTGGNINVVWQDISTTNAEILFTRSSTGGATFSTPVNLSNSAGGSHNTQIAVDSDGNINVIWVEGPQGADEIFFSRSTDDAASFSTPQNLSKTSGGSSEAQIAVEGSGSVSVVWADTTTGPADIFFREFKVDDDSAFSELNGGNTFSGDQTFSGAVTVTGNLSTSGTLRIGGGTPILGHLSQTFALSVAALTPSSCAPVQSGAFSGASDGDSLVLGVPNSLISPAATGAGILNYSAWVSAANTVSIRVCNLNPNGPKSQAVSGTIRVDIWKH